MINKQILLGSLLGDSCIWKNRWYHYDESHCLKQEAYLKWKNKFLGFNFSKNNIRCKINKCNKLFKKYYKLFYPNKKKTVNFKILNQLSPLGLAVWYCDDGSYDYRTGISFLYIQAFNLNENKLIQKWFKKKFKIDCKINITKCKDGRRKYYYLNFGVKGTQRLLKIIKPFILKMPSSMHYKLGLNKRKIKIGKFKKKEYYIKNKKHILKRRREWARKNPKKQKEYSKKYYLKNKDKKREYYKKYNQKNKDKILKQMKEYRLKNKDKILKQMKEYYYKNKEKILKRHKEWRKKNPNYHKEYYKKNYKKLEN